jgi:8-amino-7-oxononanoate synthase
MNTVDVLRSALDGVVHQHLYRRRRVTEPLMGARLRVDGRELLGFCSNDYLGLSHHPQVIEALVHAAQRGVGSGAAHLVSGHSAEHHALEEDLADFVGRERAVLFSTGYMANLGVIGALVGRRGLVVEDRLNHASLIDAGLLSGATLLRYAHADTVAAESAFGAARKGAAVSDATRGQRVLATDGLFSMDGDLAPLPELARIAAAKNAWLVVDDAHGLGVLGASGRGIVEHFGISVREVPVLVGTLGKAFGTFGAFVAGDAVLCEWLIQKARTYIYTTALPPALAAATRKALALAVTESWRRERLRSHVATFRKEALGMALQLMNSDSPIQPLLLGSAERALAASRALEDLGLWVAAIRPPTVPKNSARLRITFSAAHDSADTARLCEALADLKRRGLV